MHRLEMEVEMCKRGGRYRGVVRRSGGFGVWRGDRLAPDESPETSLVKVPTKLGHQRYYGVY